MLLTARQSLLLISCKRVSDCAHKELAVKVLIVQDLLSFLFLLTFGRSFSFFYLWAQRLLRKENERWANTSLRFSLPFKEAFLFLSFASLKERDLTAVRKWLLAHMLDDKELFICPHFPFFSLCVGINVSSYHSSIGKETELEALFDLSFNNSWHCLFFFSLMCQELRVESYEIEGFLSLSWQWATSASPDQEEDLRCPTSVSFASSGINLRSLLWSNADV